MKPWLQLCAAGARACAASAAAFAWWTLWLALGLLLALQVYVVSSQKLTLPGFLRERIEARLAAAGLRVTVGRTSFDPSGLVLAENVQVFLPAFADPVLTARAVFIRFHPRYLLAGAFEPEELHVFHAALLAPAQLSPSGRPEPIAHDLDVHLIPRRREVRLDQLIARFGELTVSLRGTLALPPASPTAASAPLGETLARAFPAFCRQAFVWRGHLEPCEQPALHLQLQPAAPGRHTLAATLLANRLELTSPVALSAAAVTARATLALAPFALTSPVRVTAATVALPAGARIRRIALDLDADLAPSPPAVTVRAAAATADEIEVEGVDAVAASVRLTPGPLPRVAAELTARILGAPLAVAAAADFDQRTADLRFHGGISPRVLDVISRRLGVDVRRYYDFDALEAEDGAARFGPGWKFERVSGRVRIPRMNSYGVIMEDGRATVFLEPDRFWSPEAFARVGENFARGTYDHNLRTREFRFLLQGRLRPLEIGTWFGPWWRDFFGHFEFPQAPPSADVDVQGVWREGRLARVMVLAETPQAVIRGTPVEDVRTRLFIRPGWIDGLELRGGREGGEVRGTFAHRTNAANVWHSLDFDFDSSLDLELIAELLGPGAGRSLAPFRVVAPPAVKARGTLHGSGAPPGSKDLLEIDARTTGEFRYHGFPLQDVAFLARLRGSELALERVHGRFADGKILGNARVWGDGADRRLGFNASLEDLHLGQAATTLQGYLAARQGRPPPPPGRFVQERANLRLNVGASAEGAYDLPLSYRGDGNAVLKGAEIGEVPLLGLLSELFTFTSLRFTEARGNFTIDGPKLHFPKIELRGANSAIDAAGDFLIDRQELNFNAKVYPFSESENVIKSVVGAVLTPLSNALEVKLTGTFEKPQWEFVMGPRSFLRSLAGAGTETPAETPTGPPGTGAPPAPETPASTPPATTSPAPHPAPSPGK